mmetsp:Transcript_10018/g.16780  ORF Transcript_10018/g.16780 Transcript_10018/m.16780 type:complete len:123 (-) Transcript_10018:1159-1527(-)
MMHCRLFVIEPAIAETKKVWIIMKAANLTNRDDPSTEDETGPSNLQNSPRMIGSKAVRTINMIGANKAKASATHGFFEITDSKNGSRFVKDVTSVRETTKETGIVQKKHRSVVKAKLANAPT